MTGGHGSSSSLLIGKKQPGFVEMLQNRRGLATNGRYCAGDYDIAHGHALSLLLPEHRPDDRTKLLVANRGDRHSSFARPPISAWAARLSRDDGASLRARRPMRRSPCRDAASPRIWMEQPSCERQREAGATAIHPGFTACLENVTFARGCAGAGVTFVGPTRRDPGSVRRQAPSQAACPQGLACRPCRARRRPTLEEARSVHGRARHQRGRDGQGG